jgi:hypothetical protein
MNIKLDQMKRKEKKKNIKQLQQYENDKNKLILELNLITEEKEK